ncbi:MAG: hypothetical protein ABI234_20415 [Ktedonobacteraceae bacterium]
MARGEEKQPEIQIDDLRPKETIAGYRATWKEYGVVTYAELLPIDDIPVRGFMLECEYSTATGRAAGPRQKELGPTLVTHIRKRMVEAMRSAGWKEIGGQTGTRKSIWQHSSQITQGQRDQHEHVSVTLDDFTLPPLIATGKNRYYQSGAIQGDVQAVIAFWPAHDQAHPDAYHLLSGIDCYPLAGEPLAQEQEKRANTVLDGLRFQVLAALAAAGWRVCKQVAGGEDLWRSVAVGERSIPNEQGISGLDTQQQQQATVTPAQDEDFQVLTVCGGRHIATYNRTIVKRSITYACSCCGQPATRAMYPGPTPLYCDDCGKEVTRKQTRERVARLRSLKAEREAKSE